MFRLVLIALISTLTACAVGMRQPAHQHPFCNLELGRLVLPGEIVDTATVRNIHGQAIARIPVYTNDSICVRRRLEFPLGRADTLSTTLLMEYRSDLRSDSRHS